MNKRQRKKAKWKALHTLIECRIAVAEKAFAEGLNALAIEIDKNPKPSILIVSKEYWDANKHDVE